MLPLAEIKCEGCGICCMHMATPPYSSVEELELPAEVRDDLRAVRESAAMQREVWGADYKPCGWFDMVTRKCRHYEDRPSTCRDFEAGGASCRAMRKDGGLPA